MNVSTKITVVLATIGLALLSILAIVLLQQENKDLRSAFERETALLGRSIKVSLENALRDKQMDDVVELLSELERVDSKVDACVFDDQENLRAKSGECDPSVILSMSLLATESPAVGAQWNESVKGGRLLMSWPLAQDGGGSNGILILGRPLTQLKEDLTKTRRNIIFTMAGFLVITVSVGILLGHLYVRMPLCRIQKAMAAFRSDSEIGPLPTPPNEIGAVAAEFNALVTALRETNERLASETEERLRLQSGLRHVDKLVTVGQLSAGLAHEIGSPLQVLSGRAQSLLSSQPDQERVLRNAKIMLEQTDRIVRIVNRLLYYAGRRPAEFTKINLATAVFSVIDLLRLEAKRRRLRLDFSTDEEIPPITADADQVQQVILNLVSNALAATPSDGTVTARLLMTTMSDGRRAVRIEVEDTGGGIDEGIRGALFQPFFTTREKEGGTGLGLAVCKAIVTEHDGTIGFSSQRGSGSCFVVELPVAGPGSKGQL